MNRYGRTAMEHWRRFVPTRFAAIEDPETFFTELGDEVLEELETLADQIAGDDPGGETHLEKVGRLNMARLQAEEMVLPQQVLVPAEPGSPMDEDQDEPVEPWPTVPAPEDLD